MKQRINSKYIFPVLLSFFVMSFIDLVGTGVDELKQNVATPRYILQLIPFVAFIWFFLLSVPIGIWQDRIGKKKALNYGILITAIGLLLPIFGNTLPVILVAFAVLGIGNTILQVSANPLLIDVVPTDKSSSFLSLSQFVKSLGSIVGPFVAAIIGPWLAISLGDTSGGAWRYGLYLFAVVSIAAWAWLYFVDIEETKTDNEQASFTSCLKLLKNTSVLTMVVGIFMVVGIDVAINSNIGNFLELKLGVDVETAKYGKSVYFFAKMIGTLTGAILLTRWTAPAFLITSSITAILALLALTFVSNPGIAWVMIFIASLGISNIFPLIFSITVGRLPQRANEISGLMMMAVSGGAILPFLTGRIMESWLEGGLLLLIASATYILIIGINSRLNN